MTYRLRAVKTILALAALIIAGLALPSAAGAATWNVDPAHSKVGFTVKHFFTPVEGSFDDFNVDLSFDPDKPATSGVKVTIPIAGINTGNDQRDDHLRSPDWFDAGKFPEMTFSSTSVKADGKDRLIATGTLTIRGHSHEVQLPIEVLGIRDLPEQMQQMMGGAKQVASFRATLSLDRNDYEVGVGSWAGTMVVGDAIDIEILIEAHHK